MLGCCGLCCRPSVWHGFVSYNSSWVCCGLSICCGFVVRLVVQQTHSKSKQVEFGLTWNGSIALPQSLPSPTLDGQSFWQQCCDRHQFNRATRQLAYTGSATTFNSNSCQHLHAQPTVDGSRDQPRLGLENVEGGKRLQLFDRELHIHFKTTEEIHVIMVFKITILPINSQKQGNIQAEFLYFWNSLYWPTTKTTFTAVCATTRHWRQPA